MNFDKAVLIYNGNAGNKTIENTLGVCVPIFSSRIESLLLLKTTGPNHAKQLCETYGDQVDLVIILGGDGTVHECINGIAGLKNRPAIAILPGGTCNDFTRTLGINQNIGQAAKQLMDGVIAPVDVLKVDGHYSLNFWGIGLIAETSMNIDPTEKERLGKLSYMLSVMRTVKDMSPFNYELDIDGDKVTGEAVMIFVANGKYIGTNPLPFKAIAFDDGLADLFIINNANFTLLKEISTMDITVQGNEVTKEIDHYRGQSITVSTEAEMDADMDGEVYSRTPAKISVLNHHLQMLMPATNTNNHQNENIDRQ